MAVKTAHEEKVVFTATLALVGFGLIMLYSASSVLALNKFGDPAHFIKKQAVWAAMGLCAMVALWKTDYQSLRKPALPMLFVTFVLLVLVFVPGIGMELNGARRWIGISKFSFQPSELMKPVLLVALAASLAKRSGKLADFTGGLLPYLAMIGAFLLLVALEPDFGTTASFGAVMLCMLYVAGARLKHLALLALPGIPWLYYQLYMVGFRKERLQAYVDPWSDPLGAGFQSIQSFLAFGSGGLFGRGLGAGEQKLLFLPEPQSDFIYSVIGEELGLAGTLSVLAVYVVIFVYGMKVAMSAKDEFGRNLAFGVTVMVGLQSFINMGVTTGLLPNKGMPLPFVSAGGTALLVAMASVGMLLSVARRRSEGGARAGMTANAASPSH